MAGQFPVVLKVLDTATGETIHHCLKAIEEQIPLWDVIKAHFFVVNLATADRASSNLRSEAFMSYLHPTIPRWCVPCHVHLLSTVQGKLCDCLKTTISGCVALGLALKPGGAFCKLREALRDVLLEACEPVINGIPPLPGSPIHRRRAAILEFCLDRSPRDQKRRLILEAAPSLVHPSLVGIIIRPSSSYYTFLPFLCTLHFFLKLIVCRIAFLVVHTSLFRP